MNLWALSKCDVNGTGGTADDCPTTNGALSMSGSGTLPVELISFTANTEGVVWIEDAGLGVENVSVLMPLGNWF
jgi:hypothetical protein